MTIVGRALVAILLALVVAGCTASAPTSTPTPRGAAAVTVQGEAARVLRIVDGDTIIVDRGDGREERLRYIGIDTPETVKPESPVERFGLEASTANKRLVEGHDVILERDISDRAAEPAARDAGAGMHRR